MPKCRRCREFPSSRRPCRRCRPRPRPRRSRGTDLVAPLFAGAAGAGGVRPVLPASATSPPKTPTAPWQWGELAMLALVTKPMPLRPVAACRGRWRPRRRANLTVIVDAHGGATAWGANEPTSWASPLPRLQRTRPCARCSRDRHGRQLRNIARAGRHPDGHVLSQAALADGWVTPPRWTSPTGAQAGHAQRPGHRGGGRRPEPLAGPRRARGLRGWGRDTAASRRRCAGVATRCACRRPCPSPSLARLLAGHRRRRHRGRGAATTGANWGWADWWLGDAPAGCILPARRSGCSPRRACWRDPVDGTLVT